MKGKMLKKIGIIGVFTFCFLLQVDLAQGDNKIKPQHKNKSNVPMEIKLNFSSVPMLNEPAVLDIEIRALRDAPNTLIDIDLPRDGFKLISGNTQLNEDLSYGSTTIYQLEVLPFALGQYKIAASATSGGSDYIFGKREALYVNIGDGYSELSKTSFKSELASHRSGALKIGDLSEPPSHVPPDQKSMEDREPIYFPVLEPGEIAVQGYWFYQDQGGVDRPLRDAKVEIWDSDLAGDTLLETTHTDNSGYYASGDISNNDSEGGGQDIYVKVFSTDDRSVRVTDFSNPSNLYYSATAVLDDVSDGYVDLGSYSLDDSDNRMAWYIYDIIANDAFDYLADNVGWRNLYNLQVRWSPTNTSDGTHYHPGGSIDLLAGDRWDSDVFLHEYGHFVMYKIYGDSMPPSPSCYSHYWGSHSSMGCAWTEGWANFLQAAIQNDRFYDDTEDQILHINFEPPTPGADHAEDEGAVAASLWDIFDPVSTSESWDAIGNGINGASNNGIWSIAYSDGPTDFIEFYGYWINSSNGYNPEITAILQHHQIDLETTRPTVTITAPTSGPTYSTSNSDLDIGGTASDNVAVTSVTWTNSRGGSGTCSGTSSWSQSGIELSSGQNIITVRARDAAGNTRTDTLTVTYTPPDTTRPTVTITAPTSGSTYSTSSAELNIGGTASDNVAVTSVTWTNSRGGSGTCSGTSSWSTSGIALSSGQNVITVTARDAAGNTGTDTLTVTYTPPDTTRPTVTITAPTSGSTYSTSSAELNIGGTAADNVRVTTVRWRNSRGGNGLCSGTSSWSTSGIALSSGQNVITVTARDAAGNTGTDTLTVTYTPPDTTRPTATITTPTSGSTYSTSSAELSIGGTAADNVGVTTVRWRNSRGGSGLCSGTSSWSNSGIVLSSGQNVITVTARDAAGNTGTDTLTVTYTPPDTTHPTVTITAPTDDSTYSTSQSQLSIGGTAADDVAVTTVSWANSRGGSGLCSGTSSWSNSGIVLSSGQNVITVTARDSADNIGTDTLTVTYTPLDSTRPTVTIDTPTSDSTFTTSNSQLEIGGRASDNVAVTSVSWTNSRGGSGTCDGTSSWSTSGLLLYSGVNVITVTARDAAGNTGTDSLTVTYTPPDAPPEIVEEACSPYDAQGMEDDTLRVPNDTSIVARIKSAHGIDEDSLEMKIEEQSVSIRMQQVIDGDDTDFWIIHSPNTLFAFDQTVNFSIDAQSLNEAEMDTYYSSFKVESEEEYDAALAKTPASTEYPDDPVIGQNTVVADPGTAIEGAEIIYGNLEPVVPRFGPLEEIPNLDIVTSVGLPLNLQPTNVFVDPVTVFIPCPGETDLGILEIYVFNPAVGWQASWETDGFIVAGSRVNHGPNDPDPTEPPTIEVQLNHFSSVQAGKPTVPISPSGGAGDENGGGGGGGGGGCFITAAAGTSQRLKMNTLTFMFLLNVGFVGFAGIRRKLKK